MCIRDSLRGSGLDQPRRHFVATRDTAKDVDQDGLDVGIVEDQLDGTADRFVSGTAAHIQEVGRLAAVMLHEIHRGHRQTGAIDHAADSAVQPNEVDAELSGPGVRRILLVTVAEGLESGMAGQTGVVERDLRVQADQLLRGGAAGGRPGDHRERVDLDEIRIVGLHRGVEALSDGHELVQQGIAQPDGKTKAACLERQEAQLRIGGDAMNGAGVYASDLLDLNAAFGRGHEHDPARRPVDYHAKVVLLGDVNGAPNDDFANGDSLDVHAQDAGTCLLYTSPSPRD